MQSIDDHADKSICKVMVGNKIDLESERKISQQEAQTFAKSFGVEYFEASAKMDRGVSEFFENLMTQAYQKKRSSEANLRDTFSVNRATMAEAQNR